MESNRLEERVALLERKIGVSKRVQLAAGLGLLLYLTSSLSLPSQKGARQQRLELVDSDGRTRVVLEADPTPRLVMFSPTGEQQVLLGLGGEQTLFGIQDAPCLSLNTGSTRVWMFARPAPTSEGLEDRHRVESAMLSMSSGRVVDGENQQKTLCAGIFPNKAVLTVTT